MPEINMAFVWIVLAVVLGIIEAATVSLISIWFAVGAVVAIIPAYFGAPIWVQILVFLVVSAVCFVFTKRFFKDVVTAEIDNLSGEGKVFISGLTWSARSSNGENIPEGAVVTVRKIEGVTLIVKIRELAEA